jgi:hypothetical protein
MHPQPLPFLEHIGFLGGGGNHQEAVDHQASGPKPGARAAEASS